MMSSLVKLLFLPPILHDSAQTFGDSCPYTRTESSHDGRAAFYSDEIEKAVWVSGSVASPKQAVDSISTTDRAEGVAVGNIDNNPTVFFSTSSGDVGSLWKFNEGGEAVELLSYNGGAPLGIAFDGANERLYWVDQKMKSVLGCDLDGGNFSTLVTNQTDPVGIAIDTRSNHLYWTTRCDATSYDDGCRQIMVAESAGCGHDNTSACAAIFLTGSGTDFRPRDLSISDNSIFFTGATAIYAALLADATSTTMIHNGLKQPFGLSVEGGRLFVAHNLGVTATGLNEGSEHHLVASPVTGGVRFLDATHTNYISHVSSTAAPCDANCTDSIDPTNHAGRQTPKRKRAQNSQEQSSRRHKSAAWRRKVTPSWAPG